MTRATIELKLCSEFTINDNGSHSFYTYSMYGDPFRSRTMPEFERDYRTGFSMFPTEPPDPSEHIRLIAHKVVLLKTYARLLYPKYKIHLWRGDYPKGRGVRITKKPEESVKEELINLFESYYELRRLVKKGNCEEAYEKFCKCPLAKAFSLKIEDRLLLDFYIKLRKTKRKEAQVMIQRYYPHLFYELETAVLHDQEGCERKKKLEGERGDIFWVNK